MILKLLGTREVLLIINMKYLMVTFMILVLLEKKLQDIGWKSPKIFWKFLKVILIIELRESLLLLKGDILTEKIRLKTIQNIKKLRMKI